MYRYGLLVNCGAWTQRHLGCTLGGVFDSSSRL